MKLYANWYDQEILTAEEYNERLDERIKEESGLYCFSEWLNDNYSATEIFNMDDDEKNFTIEEFKDFVMASIKQEFDQYWDEVEVDVDYEYEPIINNFVVITT